MQGYPGETKVAQWQRDVEGEGLHSAMFEPNVPIDFRRRSRNVGKAKKIFRRWGKAASDMRRCKRQSNAEIERPGGEPQEKQKQTPSRRRVALLVAGKSFGARII